METALENVPHCHVAAVGCGRQKGWSSINLNSAFTCFETYFKEQERDARGTKEVLPCCRSTRTRLLNSDSLSCIAVMISM
jgi:hypothetical protein